MKTKFFTISALVALFMMILSSSSAQTYPSASIILVDNNYINPTDYRGTIYGYYMWGGIPTPLSGTTTFGSLTLNSLNPVPLPWTLPYDTDQNIYRIFVVAEKNVSGTWVPSSPPNAYSTWFNSNYYQNDFITVTCRW
jgi:hypothetical protein